MDQAIMSAIQEAVRESAFEELMDEKIRKAGQKLILIVEDDPDAQNLIAMILADAGYAPRVAKDGVEGISMAKALEPDLVLLDIMLPKMDGLEVCKKLSADPRTKDIPILIVTVRKELSTKLASYVAGARRFMNKPFEPEELMREIEKALKHNRKGDEA